MFFTRLRHLFTGHEWVEREAWQFPLIVGVPYTAGVRLCRCGAWAFTRSVKS